MDFLTLLSERKIVVLDGAMGTRLDERGLMSRCVANLEAPDAVLEIHREYVNAGCDALTTNTLTMNRVYIETHNVGVDVREVNLAGARLGREAAGENICVLGDISSTGRLLEPYGTFKEIEFYESFKEQAEALVEGGVDAFLVETVFDLREALCALRACKDAASLPVLASIAFKTEQKGGRTIMGDAADECAKKLTEEGADVLGANCGDLDPSQTAAVVSIIRSATSLPILAQPNAGKPRLVGGRTVFDMKPQPFANGMAECLAAGATIVGGCCGTTPGHIRALSAVVAGK